MEVSSLKVEGDEMVVEKSHGGVLIKGSRSRNGG
jgi:hypothetical protein